MVGVAGVGAEGSIPPAPARLHHQGLRLYFQHFILHHFSMVKYILGS